MLPRLSFHGAAECVTGSCHLFECMGRRILMDCGLFQGGPAAANEADFGFDPKTIDFVLLSHAHLDHCGRLPLLVKRGFRGEIITTAATRELTWLTLMDSAHVQEEEARRRERHGHRIGDRKPAAPLYSILDTLDCLRRFGRSAEYEQVISLIPGLTATFVDAGHILGSASILIEWRDGPETRSILFSGDIGNAGRPLLRPPSVPARADFVVMESTYGDRRHRPFDESVAEFTTAIADTFARGGNVIIPTYALERAQEILFSLRESVVGGRLPKSLQVFLDSPMAITATEIFGRHPESLKPELGRLLGRGEDPFQLVGLHLTRETGESMAINRVTGGVVVMAGAGMCNGGRILHHLRRHLSRPESSIIFVGFAAMGTLARRIIDGAADVRIMGEDVPVKARIHTINGFSAHADQSELVSWARKISDRKATFLVHGEPPAMETLSAALAPDAVLRPRHHAGFILGSEGAVPVDCPDQTLRA